MKNHIIKKIVIAVLIVVAILILLYAGREVAVRFFGMETPSLSKSISKGSKKIDISFDSNSIYEHVTTDKYIYLVTTDKVLVMDDNGNEKVTLPISVEKPYVSVAGDYVLVGDIDGNDIYIIKNTRIYEEIKTQRAIKNLSINASGYCVAVTEGDMHKRDVVLYDQKGEELFVWTSGTRLVFDAVLANNNKNVIISTFDTQKATANTILNFYNISKEEPVASFNYEDEIIADLDIYGNYVCCIGESKTDIYTVSGAKKSEISYTDRTLLSYVTTKSGIVMSFENDTISDKRYSIEIYNENATRTAKHSYDYVSKIIDATNNHIVLNREGLINILDYSGKEIKLINSGFDIKDLSFVGNTRKIVGFTAKGAYIINI